MNSPIPARMLMLAATTALLLAACGGKDDAAPAAEAETADTTENAAPSDSDADAAAEPVASYPADYKIDTPVDPKAIDLRMSLVGEPVYLAAKDLIEFEVNVENAGTTAVVGAGKAPVNLGVTLAGANGVDEAPGKRDFVRARLPLIPEGETAKVVVRVPAADVDGLTIRLEPVQVGVAWFGRRFKKETFDVGTFHRCKDAAGGMCDAEEVPLASR